MYDLACNAFYDLYQKKIKYVNKTFIFILFLLDNTLIRMLFSYAIMLSSYE